jgi:hypothetical protein
MHRATAEFKASGIEQQALKIGDRAPSFTLFNQDHVQVSRTIFCTKGRWWSASSEDTGDLIATWSWRLYKESILKSEHWGQIIVLTPELERYTRALHKKLNLTTFDMLTDLHQRPQSNFD